MTTGLASDRTTGPTGSAIFTGRSSAGNLFPTAARTKSPATIVPAGSNVDAAQAAPAHSLGALTVGEMGLGGLALFSLLWLRWFQMGAGFLWPRTPDPARRLGVGLFFGTCGIFFQSLTEWVFRQTPIFFTFHIMLGALASLYYLKKQGYHAEPERKPSESSEPAEEFPVMAEQPVTW